MKRLGKILHLSKSGNLIVQLEESAVPSIGALVCDHKLKKVGTVNNVLGLVKKPYISVQPSMDISGDYAGRMLYLVESA